MKLNYDRKSKDPTYFIQQGFRNGKKTTTKNIVRIGKHSELLKLTDDPLEYAKEQVRKYNEEAKRSNTVTLELKVDFNEKIKHIEENISKSTSKNIGYFYLKQIYSELKISRFFEELKEDSKISFDPNLVNQFTVFSRILDPCSKLAAYSKLSKFYENPEFNYEHILRTMDLLSDNYDAYISALYEGSKNITTRDTSVCYYDCTNYYFEIEKEDINYVDDVTKEEIKGLRKYGLAKDHKPNPIVEMGLFMDTNGIPLSMCINSGSESEQTTAIPLEKKLSKMLNKKFIYCADAGLGSYNIRKFNSMGGRAFVVTQSVKKLSEVLKQAVFEDYDYKLLSNHKPVSLDGLRKFNRHDPENLWLYNDKAYKVIPANKAMDLGLTEDFEFKNGNTGKRKVKGILKQYLIITFSRKMMEYQRTVRNKQIERAKKLLEHINPETYKKGPNDVTRFIKKKTSNKKIDYILDEEKIAEEEKYDGFYAIATNLDDSVKTILDINSKRYKIEDCFRVLKTNFSARPVYHYTKNRIIAHFMLCYTALLIFRLLEDKLKKKGYHFTTDEIIETLKNMEVANIDDICYLSTYTGSKLCTALNQVSELELNNKYYMPKVLNSVARKLSK